LHTRKETQTLPFVLSTKKFQTQGLLFHNPTTERNFPKLVCIGLVRLMNLNIVILSTASDFKLRKTQHITDIMFYNFKENHLHSKKVKLGYNLHFVENKKNPKQHQFFTKYLASFAKNVAPLNPSSHSLFPSVNLHSHHTNTFVQQIFINQCNIQPQTKIGREEIKT